MDPKARLVPAIARQATRKVTGARAAALTARVVATALRLLGLEAHITSVELLAFTKQAWAARIEPAGSAPSARDVHPCVETDGVLFDACLDLLAVPGAGLSLRPSSFDLPPTWASEGWATFRQRHSGVVVACCVSGGDDWRDDPGQEVLIERIAGEVVEMCEKAERALAGVPSGPSRWLAIAHPPGDTRR